jgi:hypothetical protein
MIFSMPLRYITGVRKWLCKLLILVNYEYFSELQSRHQHHGPISWPVSATRIKTVPSSTLWLILVEHGVFINLIILHKLVHLPQRK